MGKCIERLLLALTSKSQSTSHGFSIHPPNCSGSDPSIPRKDRYAPAHHLVSLADTLPLQM